LLNQVFSKENQMAAITKDDINTHDTEEAETAINMLHVIIEEMKSHFAPYLETTTQLILPLCSFSTNEGLRTSSARCLPTLLICAKQ